jgi:hypothetical protein
VVRRLIHCSVVLWRVQKRNWLALSRPLSSIYFWRKFKITFPISFSVVDSRLIGRKFCRNFGTLPGLGWTGPLVPAGYLSKFWGTVPRHTAPMLRSHSPSGRVRDPSQQRVSQIYNDEQST